MSYSLIVGAELLREMTGSEPAHLCFPFPCLVLSFATPVLHLRVKMQQMPSL